MSTAERHALSFLGLGGSLAQARLARGLELRDVERDTRIRARYLSALEGERFGELPGDAYARVFLRTYAAYLGLDPDAYADELRRLRGHRDEPVAPVPSAARPSRRRLSVAAGAAVLVGAGVTALAVTVGLRDGGGTATAPAPRPAAAPPAAEPAPRPVAAEITAARGGTRMTVRAGGPNGELVWRGTLRQGRTIRFGLGRPLWIVIARPRLVDVRVGGEPVSPRAQLTLGGS